MRKILILGIILLLILSIPITIAPIARADANDTMIQNGYLQIAVGDASAKFSLGTTGGDPANPNDDNRPLLFGHPNQLGSSFTTVRIDGSDFIYGSSPGAFTQSPTGYVAYIKSVWVAQNIQVTQVLTLVLNPSTNRVDAMEIRYMLENIDSTNNHNVGLRVLLDTLLGANDGAPFQIPGTGAVTTEHEYTGASVPDYWQAFDDLNNPTVISQGTLRGGDATVPNRIIFVSWEDFYKTLWDYAITPGKTFGTPNPDSSVGLYWNPKTLGPGDRIEYVTYYGLSGLSQSMMSPLTLSVSGPLSLSVAGGAYTPNPFTIVAYVQDISTNAINSVAVSLTLPAGLTLSGSPATQTIGTLNPNAPASSVSWSVRAADQTSDVLLTYSVDAVATGVPDRTVPRSILIPANVLTYDMTFRSNPNGYQFQNFVVATLSWDLFKGTFGADEVEINGQHRPRATNYFNTQFTTFASGGSCFGMASSSLILYQNSHPAWDIGSDRNKKLDNIGEPFADTNGNGQYDLGEPFTDTSGNGVWDSVRTWGVFPSFIQTPTDWIESYQGRWADAAIQGDAQVNPTPNDAYNKLKQRMVSGNWLQDPLVLTLWWPNPKNPLSPFGHSVVPYRIEETANHQQADVRIYDNNYPNQQRTFHFDLAANTASDADYNGGNNLQKVEVNDLSAIQAEPQMADYDTVTPSAHLLYTDASGNHLGYFNGQFESEISGAYRLFVPEQVQSDQLETYHLGNLDLKRELLGLENGVATVSIMQPNYLVVADVQVTPSSQDEIQASTDGLGVQFISDQGTSSLSLAFDVQTSNFDRLVRVSGFGVEAGSSVGISFSPDLNQIFLTNNGVTKSFNIHFEQIGKNPYSHDSQAPVLIKSNSIQSMQFFDNTPPTTSIKVGDPKYDTYYVTPDTPFTLEATDDSSGVSYTAFRINSTSYDSGWLTYINPFTLSSLADGNCTISFNSTDNVGNVEKTNKISVTLFSWTCVFKDSYGRGTMLKINTAYKFFQFIVPCKDFGIRKDKYMGIMGPIVTIQYKDKEMYLTALAVKGKVFSCCSAFAMDLSTRKNYILQC